MLVSVADLQQLLRYFERGDVEEVTLQSGAPVVIRQHGRSRQLSPQPLPPEVLMEWIRGTAVEAVVPTMDTSGRPEILDLFGRSFSVAIARHGPLIQIRFRRAELADLLEPDEMDPMDALEIEATRSAAEARAESGRDPDPSTGPEPIAVPDLAPDFAVEPPSRPEPAPAAAPARPVRTSTDVHEVLRRARQLDASDVHIVAGRPVAIRVAGQLEPHGEALSADVVRAQLEPLVTGRHRAQLEELGYCDFAAEVEGAGRLRVNVNRQRTGLKGCFRLVAPRPATLAELGLPPQLAKATAHHQGLVVVAGPNGQGKTTTLAALVDMVNESKPLHVITVEDPVEVIHPRKRAVITQREVGSHTRSFQRALEAALREDPDVIVIGELRDRETVEMALSAAETGHLVIATMSSPSGSKTIDRLIDMFPPDDQSQVRSTLAGALKAVVSQRLVPTVDGRRRVAAAELITGSIPLWTLIRDDKLYQLPSLLQRGAAYGMIRIEQSLSELLQAGLISEEAARHNADDPRLVSGAVEPEPEPSAEPAEAEEQTQARGGLRTLFRRGSS